MNAAPVSLLLIFTALLVLCVTGLSVIPAYILWRMTKDKRYPMMWVTCTAVVVSFAAILTYIQWPTIPPPTPVNETLTDVADKSGVLKVTAIRIPDPRVNPSRIEVDVENTAEQEQFLGLQYKADGGTWGDFSPGSTSGTHIWPVAPKSKSTLSKEVTLPGFVFGGEVTVVLARCTSAAAGDGSWLPKDSEALYQNNFTLVPPLEAPAPSHP